MGITDSLNLQSLKTPLIELYKDFIARYEAYLRYTRPKALQFGKAQQVNAIDAIANTIIEGFQKVFAIIGTKGFELGLPIVPLVIGGIVLISTSALLLFFRSRLDQFKEKVSILEKDVLSPDERKQVISNIFGSKSFFDLGLGDVGIPLVVIGVLILIFILRR